jgi:hypothetical protein
MPVTVRLSKSFYDRFGDDIANELVEWFNSVDATYRADLREINEMNFARFDANLGERLSKVDVRFAHVDARFDQVDAQFLAFEKRMEEKFVTFEKRMEEKLVTLEKRIDERFVAFEDRIERRLAEFETHIVERIGRSEDKMRNWMIGFCTTQLFALVGLMYTILHGR